MDRQIESDHSVRRRFEETSVAAEGASVSLVKIPWGINTSVGTPVLFSCVATDDNTRWMGRLKATVVSSNSDRTAVDIS